MPPEFAAPVPTTIKLPLVLFRMIPLVLLPLADTVVRLTTKGIVPAEVRLISTAGWPLVAGEPTVVIVPLETVMLPLFDTAFVACKPRWLLSGVMITAPKVTLPTLSIKRTPVLLDPVTLVVPKLNEEPLGAF